MIGGMDLFPLVEDFGSTVSRQSHVTFSAVHIKSGFYQQAFLPIIAHFHFSRQVKIIVEQHLKKITRAT